jgi:flagellar biosynthetic protein FliR
MLTFTEAQVMQWISPFIWPFIRILALLSSMPILSQKVVPARVKVALAMLITVVAQPTLPAMPVVPLNSSEAFLVLLQQLVIGLSMGFAVRIVFSAIELAGDTIGAQMGFNFAMFFDPSSGGQVTSVARFFTTVVSLLFVTMNAHLLIMVAVVQSFQVFAVGPEPFAFLREVQPHLWGSEIFKMALWIALPLTAVLLFTNLVLGVIARVATQLQIFSIGFPITVGVGMIGIFLTLPTMQGPFNAMLEQMLSRFQ